MTNAQADNIAERNARTAKAFALAAAIEPHVLALLEAVPAGDRADVARRMVRDLPEAAVAAAADLAGTRPPSAHTWAIVANLIADRVNPALQALDPFAGLPGATGKA